MSSYSFDNRVKFVVRYMYDLDNNGYLDKRDFECLALRTTVLECRGGVDASLYENNMKIMRDLWNEIAELADFNKDGFVTVEEFKEAIQKFCVGRKYKDFPRGFKSFISNNFKTVDVDGDGLIGLEEFRLDCVTRSPFTDLGGIDEAYNHLLTDEDRKVGGINLTRYQELYAEFISNPDESTKAIYLFGPLDQLSL